MKSVASPLPICWLHQLAIAAWIEQVERTRDFDPWCGANEAGQRRRIADAKKRPVEVRDHSFIVSEGSDGAWSVVECWEVVEPCPACGGDPGIFGFGVGDPCAGCENEATVIAYRTEEELDEWAEEIAAAEHGSAIQGAA